ncbi:MAG: PBP1A family penicillin-binding protein [Candidatus Sungbacteria bacterium]|nr:PBP1A family penicillin-binding protein [Candidatus Sungbacteria bacterium]
MTKRRRHSLFTYILTTAAIFIGGGGILLFLALRGVPDPTKLAERTISQSTRIYDRAGTTILYDIHGEERRTVVPFEKIPSHLKRATIAIEDASFYSHSGVDIRGILRALYVNVTSRNIRQGGSTITQQLVKNSLLRPERSLVRKIREALIALVIEARFEKDEILGFYLNQIPYGSNAYGAEAAAETFFGHSADRLTLAESATLAALPRAPSYYSPYGAHQDELMLRKDFVLDRMVTLDFISREEADAAKREPLAFKKQRQTILAPHFVAYVREYLSAAYGEAYVERGGLRVITTLDWELQQEAEKLVKEYAERNERSVKGSNASLVAMDPKTGEILTMVGSRGYFEDPVPEGCKPGVNCRLDPQVNVTLRARQPGSAFKPFVYAMALERGYTAETILFDVPTEFNTACNPDGTAPAGVDPESCYMPGNYDDRFRGPVTVRQALAQSLNVPSVELLYLTGVEESIATANRMGITTITYDPSRYGLALVLGGAEVTLTDMVHAYGAFARDGIQAPKGAILRIEDAAGNILEEKKEERFEVLNPEIARQINDILSDNNARQPVFSPRSSIYFPDRTVAAKTGTTQDFRDAWTIGYTPSLVAGVWAGNNDNSPIQQKGSGVLAAAPLWHAFMEYALKKFPDESFSKAAPVEVEKPILKGLWQGGSVIIIDKISRKLATQETPEELRETIVTGEPHTILYWVNRNNPRGPLPENPASDPQFAHWEAALYRWLSQNPLTPSPAIPTEFDTVHTEANRPKITLVAPRGGDVLVKGPPIRVRADISAVFPLKEVRVLVNNALQKTVSNPPASFETLILTDVLDPGELIVKLQIIDEVENKSEVSVPVLLGQ